MNLSTSLDQKQIQKLTQAQQLQIKNTQLSLRLDLLYALKGDHYKPEAKCPKCSRDLSQVEIIEGFLTDPEDYTTCCTKCGHRFEPQLILRGQNFRAMLPFFCSNQMLHRLGDLREFSPEQISRHHAAIYHSAIIHHGSLKNAFKAMDVDYDKEELLPWKNKIVPFLGNMPDIAIARCVNVSAATIRNIRIQKNIERYRKAADDLDN